MADDAKMKPSTVGISPDARERLAKWCERRQGSSSKDVVTAIVAWFLDQPSVVQTVVLGVDEGMEAAYAKALRKLADEVVTVDVGVVRSKGPKKSSPQGGHSENAADPTPGRR